MLTGFGCIERSPGTPVTTMSKQEVFVIRYHQANIRRNVGEMSEMVDQAESLGPESRKRFARIARETEDMLVAFLDAVEDEDPRYRDIALEHECRVLLNKIRSIKWGE